MTPMNGWYSLDTAPRDGQRIMLYRVGPGAFEGWWHNDFFGDESGWMDDQDSEPSPIAWQPLLPGPFTRAYAATPPTPVENKMTDDQIKYMVSRFLNWRLPENFNPDGGISFEKYGNIGTEHQYKREPSGTNLIDYTQATEMVRHMIDGMHAPSFDSTNQAPKGATHMRRPEYLTAWLFDGMARMPLWMIEKYHSMPIPEDRKGMWATAVDGEFWRWFDAPKFEELFASVVSRPDRGGA